MCVRTYGDLNDPIGIAIDGEGYSLVSEYRGNCLSIFHSQGNKIHTVGDLNKPDGILNIKGVSQSRKNCL